MSAKIFDILINTIEEKKTFALKFELTIACAKN